MPRRKPPDLPYRLKVPPSFEWAAGTVLLEYRPCLRTVITCRGRYHLKFPYLLFRVRYKRNSRSYYFTSLNVAWAVRSPKLWSTKVHTRFLPNCPGGYVCMPFVMPGETLDELVRNVIGKFWSSTFTGGVGMLTLWKDSGMPPNGIVVPLCEFAIDHSCPKIKLKKVGDV